MQRVLEVLKATCTLLETMGRTPLWLPPDAERTGHLLLLNLPLDEHTYTLQLSCIDEWLQLPDDLPTAPWLHFYVLLPLIPAEEHVLALAQMLVRVNQTLPLGSFGLNEANGVHFVYRLLWHEAMGPAQLVQVIQLMTFALRSAPAALDAVAQGQQTPQEAQAQLEQQLLKLAHSS